MHNCDKIKATFVLEEIVSVEGEECARITGGISNWPDGISPKVELETLFSLKRKVPVKSSLKYESPSRTERIEVTLKRYQGHRAE